MKIILNIIRFIAMFVLAVSIIFIVVLNIFSSTILNKQYILNVLKKTEFYDKIYMQVNSNFENYIYQSGLDENVIIGICSKEKVENDINIIISNIYSGTKETIDLTEIKDNLNSKINLLNIKNSKNADAINTFVDTIADEYEETILHTKYEESLNNYIEKINELIKIVNRVAFVMIIINIIILLIANIKKINQFINEIGIATMSSGIFIVFSIYLLNNKVKIANIKLLDSTFTNTLITVLQETIDKITTIGIMLASVGIIFIIICSIIKTVLTDDEVQGCEK